MAVKQRTRLEKAFFASSLIALIVLCLLVTLRGSQRVAKLFTLQPALPRQLVPYHEDLTAKGKQDPALNDLLQILQQRLGNYSGPKLMWTRSKCPPNVTGAGPCYDTACPGNFSSSLKERLGQLLSTRTAIPAQYREALASAARAVTSHKYVFVTGASSNHYREMQALLDNVFTSLLPRMKGKDYTLVVYNLGLSPTERKLTEKNCRCTLIDFPFAGLPPFVKHLGCYVWKPLVVASLLEKAEYLVWMDASIRWQNSTPLAEMFRQAKAYGYQTRYGGGSIAVRTQASMAQFFGDHLCQYAPFTEMATGLIFYYNDRFMREAIMQPWLSCAFNRSCMCVKDFAALRNCARKKPNRYGTCHRYEQSSIGMILSRLFLEYRPMLYVPRNDVVKVKRGHLMNWFHVF